MTLRPNTSKTRLAQIAARSTLALTLVVPVVYPESARAAVPNNVLTPVTHSLSWVTAPVSVTGDAFRLDVSARFPQLNGPVQITASSNQPAVAVASVTNGMIEVGVKGAGTARIAIVGAEASSLTLTDTIQVDVTLLGDTNGDGVVTSADVLYIQKVATGKIVPSDEEKNRLDINRDGLITNADATLLMSNYVGKTALTGGVAFIVSVSDVPDAPIATAVGIAGTVKSGETLTGTYRYADSENDAETGTTYAWFRGEAADGSDRAPIAGAVGSSYVAQDDDVGHYLFFAVTPRDARGLVGASVSARTNALVPDTAPPVVIGKSPVSGAANAGRNESFGLTFNEPVFAIGGKRITLRSVSGDSVLASYYADDTAHITVNGATVTIVNPGLDDGVAYYIEIEEGAFVDAADNRFAGLSGSSDWRFSTPDTIAPTIAAFSPANDATNVNPAASLTITFSENVLAVSGGKKITISKVGSGAAVASYDADDTAKISINGNVVTILNPGLADLSAYRVTIEAGSFTDTAGNAFAGLSGAQWSFGTADVTAPVYGELSPANDAVGVPINAPLSIAFDEPIHAVSGHSIKLRKTADNGIVFSYDAADADKVTVNGNVVSFYNPGLEGEAAYYLEIEAGAFADAANNAFAGISGSASWRFATPDTTAPTISALSPVHNGMVSSNSADLTVTFNEPVYAVDGKTITIRKSSDQSAFETYTLGASPDVSVSGSKVTIRHSAFTLLADYEVDIDAGAFRDAAGNGIAAITGANVWKFSSFDTRALAAATDVPLTESNLGTQGVITVTLTGDSFNPEAEESDFRLNNAPPGVTILSIIVLPDDTATAYVFLDFDGTDFDTPYDNVTVTALGSAVFSGRPITSGSISIEAVIEPEPPAIVGTVPSANAVNVSRNADLSFTFDQDVTAVAGKKARIYRKSDDRLFQEIAVDDLSKVTVSSRTVTLKHDAFSNGKAYYVLFDEGAFVNANQTGNPAMTSATAASFQVTADVSAYFSHIYRGPGGLNEFAFEVYYSAAVDGNNPIPGNTYSVWCYQYNKTTHAIIATEVKQPFDVLKGTSWIVIDSTFYSFFDLDSHPPYFNDDSLMYDTNNLVLKALVLKKGNQILDVIGDPTATGEGSVFQTSGHYLRKPGTVGGTEIFDMTDWNQTPISIVY